VTQHGRVDLEPFDGAGRLELQGKGQDRPDSAEEADSVCTHVSVLGGLMDQRPDQVMREDGAATSECTFSTFLLCSPFIWSVVLSDPIRVSISHRWRYNLMMLDRGTSGNLTGW